MPISPALSLRVELEEPAMRTPNTGISLKLGTVAIGRAFSSGLRWAPPHDPTPHSTKSSCRPLNSSAHRIIFHPHPPPSYALMRSTSPVDSLPRKPMAAQRTVEMVLLAIVTSSV